MVYFDNGTRYTGHRQQSTSDYKREETKFRNVIPPTDQSVDRKRYHLIICAACPWAHRCHLAVKVKGLDDYITVSVVSPIRDDDVGWAFGDTNGVDKPFSTSTVTPTVDNASGNTFKYLYELYLHAAPNYTGNITTPVLYDSVENKIVSNESKDIIRMLDTWIDTGMPQIYPTKLRTEIDEMADWIQEKLNNGVYRSGLAKSQDAYQRAVNGVFECLDKIEVILSNHRYLISNSDFPTVADWQLFPTLIRFDAVYHILFKCAKKRLSSYYNISNYVRDLFQYPGVESSVSLKQIRHHYFTTFTSLNPSQVIPIGNDESLFLAHDRTEKFSKTLQIDPSATEESQKDKALRKAKGEFVRGQSGFRNWIFADVAEDGLFKAESNRYHLIIANNCPWCHRVVLSLYILGLEKHITVDVLFYRRDPTNGWQFLPNDSALRKDELELKDELLTGKVDTKDRIFGFTFVPEFYKRENSTEKSVPILFDKKTKQIVNNESAEIIRIFATQFKAFHRKDAPNLYPISLAPEIEELNKFIYNDINNGAYKAGFSSDQEKYELAFKQYFATLERIDGILEKKRFLTGNSPTEADVRLLPTIVRHDPVYFVRMRLNCHMIADYPYLNRWFKDMMKIPGAEEATNIEHCVRGYFGRTGNNIIPTANDDGWY